MALELYHTSAPAGLRPGSSGFCTVAMTVGMPAALAERLEALGGYRLPEGWDPRNAPRSASHLRLDVGGRSWSVLSQVGPAPPDHTGRTNKLAHHVVVEPEERCGAGPAWLIRRPGVMDSEFHGAPRWLPAGRTLPQPPPGAGEPAECRAWAAASGDAGWAGMLANQFMLDASKPCSVVYGAEVDPLALVEEAVALLPEADRWRVTFATCFQQSLAGAACAWRFCLQGTPAADEAWRVGTGLWLDLAALRSGDPAGASTAIRGNRFVDAARTGVDPAPAPLPAAPQPAAARTVRTAVAPQPEANRAPQAPAASRGPGWPLFTAAAAVAVVAVGVAGVQAVLMRGERGAPPAPPAPAASPAASPALAEELAALRRSLEESERRSAALATAAQAQDATAKELAAARLRAEAAENRVAELEAALRESRRGPDAAGSAPPAPPSAPSPPAASPGPAAPSAPAGQTAPPVAPAAPAAPPAPAVPAVPAVPAAPPEGQLAAEAFERHVDRFQQVIPRERPILTTPAPIRAIRVEMPPSLSAVRWSGGPDFLDLLARGEDGRERAVGRLQWRGREALWSWNPLGASAAAGALAAADRALPFSTLVVEDSNGERTRWSVPPATITLRLSRSGVAKAPFAVAPGVELAAGSVGGWVLAEHAPLRLVFTTPSAVLTVSVSREDGSVSAALTTPVAAELAAAEVELRKLEAQRPQVKPEDRAFFESDLERARQRVAELRAAARDAQPAGVPALPEVSLRDPQVGRSVATVVLQPPGGGP